MVPSRAEGKEIANPVNPVADDPVLLQPGLTLPGLSREEAVTSELIDPAQRKQTQDVITVLGNNEVESIPEMSVEALTHFPKVRQVFGGHNLLPNSLALFQV
jgi:hypothetical protein